MDDLYLSHLLSRPGGRLSRRLKLLTSLPVAEGVGVLVIAVIDLKK